MSEYTDELVKLVAGLGAAGGTSADPVGPLWRQVRELGLAGIGLEESLGGSGGGLGDLVVVVGELAFCGLPTPIVEASTAAFATQIVAERDGFGTIVVASGPQPGDVLRFNVVPFAAEADHVVVVDTDGVGRLDGSAVEVTPGSDIAGLPCGSVVARSADLEPTTNGPTPGEVRDRLALCRSSALLGSARAAYGLTRRYVSEREQFGAPLIKISAVTEALARMSIAIRQGQLAVEHAVVAADTGDHTRRAGAVAAARIVAADAATLVARVSHQLHGAIGVTREYDLQRHTRRLWAWRDADEPAGTYEVRLGAAARRGDEECVWDVLTS